MKLMKLFMSFILTLGFFNRAQCQIIYTYQDERENWYYGISEQPGTGNFLISAASFNYNQQLNTYRGYSKILILSPYGDLIGSIGLDSNFLFTDRVVWDDKNYFIGGSQIINTDSGIVFQEKVLKLDESFQVVTSRVIDAALNYAIFGGGKLLMTSNRIYLGYTINQPVDSFKLFKLDKELNILDSSVFNMGSLHDVELYGNHLLVSGRGLPFQSILFKNQVIEMDTSFTPLSYYSLDSLCGYNIPGCASGSMGVSYLVTNVIGLSDRTYYVTGYDGAPNADCQPKIKTITGIIKDNQEVTNAYIAGIDSVNNVYFTRGVSSSANNGFVYSVALAGYDSSDPKVPQANNTFIYVHKSDTAGNLVWAKEYGGDMYYLPLGIYATDDGGSLVCGIRYDNAFPEVPNVPGSFVLRLDKDGELTYTGLLNAGLEESTHSRCFPNPATNSIAFDAPLYKHLSLTISDAQGKVVWHTDDYVNLSSLNISGFKPGIYFYELIAQSKRFTGKFAKD